MKDLLFRTLQDGIGSENNSFDSQVLYQLFTLPIDDFELVIKSIFRKENNENDKFTLDEEKFIEENLEFDVIAPSVSKDDASSNKDIKNNRILHQIDNSVMLKVYEKTRKNYIDKSSDRMKVQTSLDDFSLRIEMVKAVSNGHF